MSNLKVTFAEMDSAATQLTSGEHQISSDLDRLQGIINTLVNEGFSTDHASKAFHESYQKFTTGAKNVIQGIEGMAEYLKKASQAMQDTDTSLANAIRG